MRSLQIRLAHSLVCQNDLYNENRRLNASIDQRKLEQQAMSMELARLRESSEHAFVELRNYRKQLNEYWRQLQRSFKMCDSDAIYGSSGSDAENNSNYYNNNTGHSYTAPPLLGIFDQPAQPPPLPAVKTTSIKSSATVENATTALETPDSDHSNHERILHQLAEENEMSLNQWLLSAITEKINATKTQRLLDHYVRQENEAHFQQILARVPDVPPLLGDEL